MDIVIITVDPSCIDADEVKRAVEDAGYFVDQVEVRQRHATFVQ